MKWKMKIRCGSYLEDAVFHHLSPSADVSRRDFLSPVPSSLGACPSYPSVKREPSFGSEQNPYL